MTKLEKFVLMQLIDKIKEANKVISENYQSAPDVVKTQELLTEAENICDIFTESK